MLEILPVVQHDGFAPKREPVGAEAIPADLARGDEVPSVRCPGRQPVAADQEVRRRRQDEILLRRSDRRIAGEHAAHPVVGNACRAVEEHAADGTPVGTEPALEVVADHGPGRRVDDRRPAEIVVRLAPEVTRTDADRDRELRTVR